MVAGGMCGCWGGMHGCGGCGGCIGYDEIRSMSGRYASYWNAFLYQIKIHRRFSIYLGCAHFPQSFHKHTIRFKTTITHHINF